jgi:hypothetical protein
VGKERLVVGEGTEDYEGEWVERRLEAEARKKRAREHRF